MTIQAVRRVATYERVSSEDQRERETIKTQTDAIARQLDVQPEVLLIERFVDDGVSGMISLAERPAGKRLLAVAEQGRFDELWVYKYDRLGRNAVDLLLTRRRFDELGIALVSVVEGQSDLLGYDVQAVVADHQRRDFLRRSADGMARAARDGRYTGGIVPLGYRAEGKKPHARLVPDDSIMWVDRTAVDIVRMIYRWLAVDGRSCRWVAEELNRLAVPTHYMRDGRGVRGKRTQGLWRAGHVRNLVVNPVYRGDLQYGRRSSRRSRDIISARIEPLVTEEIWNAAQETLVRNRIAAKNTKRAYLLRSVIRCGVCGLTYCGAQGRPGVWWYRCNGQIIERGPLQGRCLGQSIRGPAIEAAVWGDIERWLRDPDEILDDIDLDAECRASHAVAEADAIALAGRLEGLERQRAQAIKLNIRGVVNEDELNEELARIALERVEIERRLTDLQPPEDTDNVPEATIDLLAELRRRLDEGLNDVQRHEIVRLLVRRIVVQTEVLEGQRKHVNVIVDYHFPNLGVVKTDTGRGSSPRPS